MSVGLPPALLFKAANAKIRRDPLQLLRFASDAQRRLIMYVAQGLETLFRAGNSSGKTWIGAALAVALLRGLKELGGIKLPTLPSPCVGWCLVQTYKGQIDGSQAAVLYWLGDWPHKAVYGRSENIGWIDTLWIATDACRHGMDERCDSCSKLVFHCSESDSGVGGKVHFVWADEPPKKKIWDECRQRGGARNLLLRWITATPKEKSWWEWMPADFHDCEDKPRNGFVEIRSSLKDNKFLAPEVLAQKLAAAEKDVRPKAVMDGDYVDLVGECPFPPDRLDLWLERARTPRIKRYEIVGERRTEDGDTKVPIQCEAQIWYPKEENEVYIAVMDGATMLRLDHRTGLVAKDWVREGSSWRGVPDPCGLHLYSRRKKKLVARFIGYSGAYGLGSLGALIAAEYGEVLIDTDLTGGHGDPTVRAMTEAGHYRLNNWTSPASNPQQGSRSLGFKMNATNRAEMVAAIQMALLNDSLLCESEEVVRALQSITYVTTPGGTERAAGGYGVKDEDMICMGRFLYLDATLPLPAIPYTSPLDKMRRIMGQSTVQYIGVEGVPEPDDGVEFWG